MTTLNFWDRKRSITSPEASSMMFKHNLLLALIATIAVVAGCNAPPPPAPKVVAETIYTGGDIVTVNDAQPTVEALAVKDGKILAVGARGEIEAYRGSTT